MFQTFSENILKEVEVTKDQMQTKALAIEEVDFISVIILFIPYVSWTLDSVIIPVFGLFRATLLDFNF